MAMERAKARSVGLPLHRNLSTRDRQLTNLLAILKGLAYKEAKMTTSMKSSAKPAALKMTGQSKPKAKHSPPRSKTAEDYKKQDGWQVGTVYRGKQMLKDPPKK